MLRISFFTEFINGLRDSFFDDGIIQHVFVHVIECDVVFFGERMFVQPPCFAHLSAESVAVDGMLKERFRCPNEDLCLICRQICYAQGPDDEFLSSFVQVCDAEFAAETFVFMKVVAQGIAQWQ